MKKQNEVAIQLAIRALEDEVLRLNELKLKGKFNLLQSEHALKRLTGAILNIFIKDPDTLEQHPE